MMKSEDYEGMQCVIDQEGAPPLRIYPTLSPQRVYDVLQEV